MIDEEKLSELFSLKPTKQVIKQSPRASPRPGGEADAISIINGGKSRNIEILLSKFKNLSQNYTTIVETLDTTNIDKSQHVAMTQMVPTDEEIEDLLLYKGEISNLSKVDQLCLSLTKIPNLRDNLTSLGYLLTLESNDIISLKSQIKLKRDACIQLVESKMFVKLLEVILAIGNAMNKGNTKTGNAKGFKLDVLLTLSNTKSSDNSMTLLDYIVTIVVEKHEEVKEFYNELSLLESATRIATDEIVTQSTEISRIHSHFESQVSLELDKTRAYILKAALEKSETECQSIKTQIDEMKEEYIKMCSFYGEDPTRKDNFIFHTITSFIKEYKKSYTLYQTQHAPKSARLKRPDSNLNLKRTCSMDLTNK